VIRRTFRRGIRLGALAGIAYGVAKVLQNRREGGAPAPWQPVAERPPDSVPAPVRAAPRPPPAAKPTAVEPEPEPEPEPEAAADAEPEAEAEAVEAPPAGDAPPAPAAPKGEFNLERVRPARPGTASKTTASKTTASKDTAKRAAVKRTSTRASVADRAWVEPSGQTCPPSHPIKAKKPSFLYHLPGMSAYERTKPDRCYRDERSAHGDGFLKAKR